MADMSIFDQDLQIVNSDDLAEVQDQQDVVNAGAAETMTHGRNIAPSDVGVDSSAIEKALSAMASEREALESPSEGEEQVSVEGEDGDESASKTSKKLSPYQKRVQSLIAERERARQELNEFKKSAQAQFQQFQSQQEVERVRVQNEGLALQRRQIEILERDAAAKSDAGMSEIDRARLEFRKSLQSEVARELAPQIEAAKREASEAKAAYKAIQEKEAQTARYQEWNTQSRQALEKSLIAGFDAEDARGLAPELEEMLFTYAGSYGLEPAQAAPHFKNFLSRYVRAEAKRISKTAGKKVAQSVASPKPLPSGRTGGGASAKLPSLVELRANGYDNHPQWMGKGSPALSKRA